MKSKDSIINKRYYLHRVLRKKNISFSSNSKTIYLPVESVATDKAILNLVDQYNYVIQFEIPQE